MAKEKQRIGTTRTTQVRSVNGPLISIIMPCFNEADSIRPFYKALAKAVQTAAYNFEFIFVDDGSRDDTIQQVRRLAETDPRIIPLELARNFGKEIAITAGMHASRGEAAITIDVDLQHPPELIPEFLERWEAGAEVVIGVRDRRTASRIKRSGSAVFYRIMGLISDVTLIPDATDYRLVDRTVIEEFNRFTERNRLTRGLVDWLGFKHDTVHYTEAERQHGEAAYSLRKLVGLALNSFVSMSLLPLKLAGYVGTLIMISAGLIGFFVIIEQIILHDPMGINVTGTSELGILILFMIGMVLAALGLISLYVAAIHTEVINRPLYVVRRPRSRRNADRPPLLSVTKDSVEEYDAEA